MLEPWKQMDNPPDNIDRNVLIAVIADGCNNSSLVTYKILCFELLPTMLAHLHYTAIAWTDLPIPPDPNNLDNPAYHVRP